MGSHSLIVNAVGSSIARACDGDINLHAGPEIAVVATKTFVSTCSLSCYLESISGA